MAKFNRFLLGVLYAFPCGAYAAGGADFNMAAQLLSAARNGNTRLVQNLINSGADVNYVDSTGVSVVCTAVMNNDTRAVQVLQMYGADASQCDRQIKNYRARTNPAPESGVLSGLTSTQKLVLGVVGAGAVVAGLLWLTDAFDGGNDNDSGAGNSGGHSGGGSSSGDGLTASLTVPYSPAYLNPNGSINTSAVVSADTWMGLASIRQNDFNYLKNLATTDPSYMQNYLLISHGYNLFANRYNGQRIFRNETTNNPLVMSGVAADVDGGLPAIVALITENGINPVGSLSHGGIEYALSVNGEVKTLSKYANFVQQCEDSTCSWVEQQQSVFDLSGTGTIVNDTAAASIDNNAAKIVAGWVGDRASDQADLYGFVPNGRLAVFRTGNTENNYQAIYNAVGLSDTPGVIANVKQNANSVNASYETIDDFSTTDMVTQFVGFVDNYYATGQSEYADDKLFSRYNNDSPVIINSVGGYDTTASSNVQNATFENYVPVVYSSKVNKNFISVVAVQHSIGTSSATNVSGYGDGTGSGYGKIRLSEWTDSDVNYRSRACGFAGVGTDAVDPWCFAAPGDRSEYAVASMAGAVANVQKAFAYMSNQQIFNLLALTADGPYLAKNSNGDFYTTDDLVAYLKSKYTISDSVDTYTGDVYLSRFKETFGYGLINLQRATTPNNAVYYYSNGKIVGSDGNTYWQSVLNTSTRVSSVFGLRSASIPVSFYDNLTSVDGDISLPRVWHAELKFGDANSHGLYMGDTLAELKTRDVDDSIKVGNLTFGFARSERMYDDNMNGLDNLSLAYGSERFGMRSEYQHYLTDGAGRFTGLANPILSLTSNALSQSFDLRNGRFGLFGRGFIGAITTEGLLENDPVVSNNFAAAKLGDAVGAESGLKFNGEKLSVMSSFGTMHESNTVLGARFGDAFGMVGADTNYVDTKMSYKVSDDIDLMLRGTFAWTNPGDVNAGVISGVSTLQSNAFAAAARFGNFDLAVSMPLALTDGKMYYSYADFVVDDNNNLSMRDAGEYALDLTPDCREYRFNASYRHSFGEWTDGALGFIYRVNPNNTDVFGNESIFMFKMSHRLGI